jgi:shikimate kinase
MCNNFSNPNIIILLGYMGCGKSTIGKGLADKLNIVFTDLDDVLSADQHCTISKLFDQKGPKVFRQLEHQALLNTLNNETKCVLSLGGGTPCYYDTMERVAKVTPNIFYLKASATSLATRLFPEKDSRPLISHISNEEDLKDFIAKHLFERKHFYAQAKHTINVDNKAVLEVINAIAALI